MQTDNPTSEKGQQELTKTTDAFPAELADELIADSGAGQEMMTKDDYAIPRISILQVNSPQVNRRDEGAYIEGAEPSMIMENVSNALFDGEKGITVVPIRYRQTVIEWKLRENGGGFVADHGRDSGVYDDLPKDPNGRPSRDDKGRIINKDGNQLVDTAEYYVFIIGPENWQPAVLSMSSTQMPKSKRWNTLIDQIRVTNPADGKRIKPAMFYMAYDLTTVPESNDKGSWFGWSIKKHGSVFSLEHGQDVYLSARFFNQQIKSGDVKVADPVAETTIESEDTPM